MLADAATETALSFLKDVGSTPLVTIVNAGAVRSSLPAVGLGFRVPLAHPDSPWEDSLCQRWVQQAGWSFPRLAL